jgi:hypothetical protein
MGLQYNGELRLYRLATMCGFRVARAAKWWSV